MGRVVEPDVVVLGVIWELRWEEARAARRAAHLHTHAFCSLLAHFCPIPPPLAGAGRCRHSGLCGGPPAWLRFIPA
jgi:hypothetical protein